MMLFCRGGNHFLAVDDNLPLCNTALLFPICNGRDNSQSVSLVFIYVILKQDERVNRGYKRHLSGKEK